MIGIFCFFCVLFFGKQCSFSILLPLSELAIERVKRKPGIWKATSRGSCCGSNEPEKRKVYDL